MTGDGRATRYLTPIMVDGLDFETFYRAHRSSLVRLVQDDGADEQEAGDAVQTAFVRLLQSGGTIRNPRAWLFKVALREYRRSAPQIRSRRRRVVKTLTPLGEVPEPADPVSAADAAAITEERQVVLDALAALPDKQRQVMAWHYDGLSHAQIGQLLGLRGPAVRQNLRKARKALQKRLALLEGDAS